MSSPTTKPEPVIDSRVKSTHFVMKTVFNVCCFFGAEPYRTFRKMLPLCPPQLVDGIRAQDIEIPPARKSVYEPANSPLVPVKVRVYTKEGNTDKLPILIIYHGGGFVLGTVAQEPLDKWIRMMVKAGNFLAASVDYRLAPEHKFPAAIDDSIAAVLWAHAGEHPLIMEHGDPNKIVLLGESSGGNLVAVTTQVLAKDYPEIKVAHQVLVSATMHLPEAKFTESRKRLADGYMLWKGMQDVNGKHYIPSDAPKELVESFLNQPLLGTNFGDLPSAHIVVGEADMLQDECRLYYEALKSAGVDATFSLYENSVHGFFGMQFLPEAQRAFADVIKLIHEKTE